MSFKDYSLVPGDNTELGDGTYIGPNMLRNKVRPALQQLAADGKELANTIAALPEMDIAASVAAAAASALAAGTDATQTAADRVQTGLDRVATGVDRNAAAASASAIGVAAAVNGRYPTTAATYVPKGLTQASVGTITGGSGGTNGTFALAWSGGNFTYNPTGTFTVAGGALTAVTITGPGLYIGASPTVPTPSFAASSGLSGASVALTAQVVVPSGGNYLVQSSDNLTLLPYYNNSGTPDLATGLRPVTSGAAIEYNSTPVYSAAIEAVDYSVGMAIDATTGAACLLGVNATTINGVPGRGLVSRRDSGSYNYKGGIHYIPWCGQSLQEGHVGGLSLTTAQEYGTIGFPLRTTSPSSYQAAIASDYTFSGTSAYGAPIEVGESPQYGISYLGEYAAAMDGVDLATVNLRYLIANNATGSTNIVQNSPGGSTGNYARVIGQVTSAQTIATAEGWPLTARAVMWNQGESDTTYSTYLAALKSLATSYQTDIKAITGDTNPVYLILNQTNSAGPQSTTDRWGIARAQFQAMIDQSNILISTPKYMMDYGYDTGGLHITARDAKWCGAYDSLVYQRVIIEGGTWSPLYFTFESRVGNYVFLKAVGNEGPLVIDETFLPAQNGSGKVRGFTCVNAALSPINVNSVTLAGSNRIRVELASYASGHRIQYALNTAVGRGNFVGGCGNIRDSLGDRIPKFVGNGVNRKMHKWAIAHEVVI